MHSWLCVAAFVLVASLSQSVWAADLVLKNAQVYTVDAVRSWASTVAIDNGVIVYVGDEAGAPVAARVVDMGGKMLLPGFQDVHTHPSSGGVAYTGCPIYDLGNLEAILDTIRRCVDARPDEPVLRGRGWCISDMGDRGLPRKEWLDSIDDTRPLVFKDCDGHALWVNSAALEAYAISRDTPDPAGGRIERDPGSGEPRGSLHEESAMNLVTDHWPPFTDAEIERGLRYTQDYFHSLGITAIQDAHVDLEGRREYRSIPAWVGMRDAGDLKMRVSLAMLWTPGGGMSQIEAFRQARKQYHGDLLRVNMIKFWADGVAETHTAKMLEPYANRPGNDGLLMIPRDELIEGVTAVDAAGFQVHIHAIGDATTRYALDAFEAAWAANGRRDARHLVNHLQFIDPADIPRFAALGIGASFEPYWAYFDDYVTDFTLPAVGPERTGRAYPIGSVARSGARIAFSSDWSVSSADPRLGIETAVTRADPHRDEGDVFVPGERIDLATAIAAYTIDAAYLSGWDDDSGSIEVGKRADLVVLAQNLFDLAPEKISDVEIVATIFAGEVVYGSLQ